MSAAVTIPIAEIKWDPSIYPRSKWSTSTIERYADALGAGDEFPPVILEPGTNVLLDGKHRVEAHKNVGLAEIKAEYRPVPDGVPVKVFAASLSARHGDRMSNADLKALAREAVEADPELDAAKMARLVGVAPSTVNGWVSDIVNARREERFGKVARLLRLGWTQQQIADVVGVDRSVVSRDVQNNESAISHVHDLLNTGVPEAEVARRFNLPDQVVWACALDHLDDEERLKALGIKVQPYDVWQFPACHDLMGDRHPGRIPGELVCHALYFLTKHGDLVVDPMAGSGTTLDAALLMGRKARGYDIDHRHDRVDIEKWNLDEGWPDTVGKASLVFWDPPYFDKMDHGTIGDDGYVEGSISGRDPDDYLDWFRQRFAELHKAVKPGTRLAFLMSDWDPENAKRHGDHAGLWLWDYADALRAGGWTMRRHIQAPLSTQQVHPDIVNKFRASRRMARLERYLLVAEA